MKLKIILSVLIVFAILGCITEFPKQKVTPTQAEFQYGIKYPAKVVYVYDGDTIKVKLDNKILVIRMLGIDTPEKYPNKNKPYEYDAITNLTYLAKWGIKAKNFTYKTLYGKKVYIEFDEIAGLKGYYGRYLAYIYIDGKDFNALLVEKGLARVYKEGKFRKENYYLQLERIARENKVGLWRIAE